MTCLQIVHAKTFHEFPEHMDFILMNIKTDNL
jgi:BarA-like signal transduction histidine kinase